MKRERSIKSFFPILDWLPNYQGKWFRGDVIAALTLFFANAHDFMMAVRQQIEVADPTPTVVLLDGESINDIDATAIITLKEFEEQLESSGIQLRFARVKSQVMDVMISGGLEEAIPEEHFYASVQTAVDAYLAEKSQK